MKLWQPIVLAQAALARARRRLRAARAQSNADRSRRSRSSRSVWPSSKASRRPRRRQARGRTVGHDARAGRRVQPHRREDRGDGGTRATPGPEGPEDLGLHGPDLHLQQERRTRAGFQFLNRVDDDGYNHDNSYFGAAVLDFTRETDSGTRWNLTLAPNRGVGSVFDGGSPIHEASVSVPITDPADALHRRSDCPTGRATIPQPTLNKLITHNLLFDFTLPTAYTGAGMEITSGSGSSGVLANMNTSKKSLGQQDPGDRLPRRLRQGRVPGLRLRRRVARQGGELPRRRRRGAPSPALRPEGHARRPVRRRCLLHPRRLDGAGPAELRPAEERGHHRRSDHGTTSCAPPVVGPVDAGRLQRGSALRDHARLDFIDNKKNGGGLLGYNFADDRNGIGPDDGRRSGSRRQAHALTLGELQLQPGTPRSRSSTASTAPTCRLPGCEGWHLQQDQPAVRRLGAGLF